MEGIMNIMSIALMVMMFVVSSGKLPVELLGRWSIGVPYDTPGPIGINAKQEKLIMGLHLVYSADHLHVCGKDVPAQPIEAKLLTSDQFLQAYGFLPHVIGMKSSQITDLTLNPSGGMNACGEYENPGVHVLIDQCGHVVMEVANGYFPLRKE